MPPGLLPALRRSPLLLVAVLGLASGGAASAAGSEASANALWTATTLAALAPAVGASVQTLRRGDLGVDLIAILAMAGALLYGEFLAGAIIALMFATGTALERYAASRAERELAALVQRAPHRAHRLRDGALDTIDVEAVVPGDRLLVKDSDIVPVDGVVASERAVLDESALTGESRPVTRARGDRLSSGTVNAGGPFEMVATAGAGESTYARIIDLVREARAGKSPFVRLADRYAALFVPASLAVAAAAWAWSGDPARALAVLVVATPCPLLLAAPIAIVSGISRAAHRGIIVKGGGALETLARGQALLLDKTGTLTLGAPVVRRVLVLPPWTDEDELLRLAASLDQLSSHVLAAALVHAVQERALALAFPADVREEAGDGIRGWVDGREVLAGRYAWVAERSALPEGSARLRRRASRQSNAVVYIAVDGVLAGAVLLDDPVRPDAPRAIRALKQLGIREVTMVTGDHASVAHSVGAALGVDRVLAEARPEDKVEAVRATKAEFTTLMVGDGINDAPALAAADVGIAMGARGASSSSEAADVVLVVDRLDRVVEAMRVARRSRRIALESVWLGMGLSFLAMGVAAVGLLPPVGGALLQEGIDALAILNALRALGGPVRRGQAPRIDEALAQRLRAEHRVLIPALERLRNVAEQIGDVPPADALALLEETHRFVADVIVPHELADETEIYPLLDGALGGDDPLGLMRRSHQEIFHLARQLEALLAGLPSSGPEPEDLPDVYRVLYALHAVLALHFAQEEELYLGLHDHYLEMAKPGPADTPSEEPALAGAPR